MSRYIDAEKLKESVEGLQDCYNGFSDTYDKACIIGLIDEEPTADVVPVVRCKDCMHNTKLFNDQGRVQFGDGVCPCKRAGADPYIDWDPDPDWFCADGEKVTDRG